MSRTVFRLILLISCAHALVHVFELALPSVEQMIGAEFHASKQQMGLLGTVWRVPFGIGAVLTGWLVDRFGSKPLLLIYLAGCVATAVMAGLADSFDVVFVSMLLMGCFASIYHPAGLALISHATTPETRGAALGWHGIFGSVGIAAAPFMAGMIFTGGNVTWKQYYFLLTIPAGVLFVVMASRLKETYRDREPDAGATAIDPEVVATEGGPATAMLLPNSPKPRTATESPSWKRYAVLVTAGALSGFIYAGFMHFLPRYLDSSGLSVSGVSPEGLRNRLAALVLICGVAGQSIAGKLAKPGRLEWLLVAIMFANAPLLVWMAVAGGKWRVVATCSLALVHFMNQPVYNSLIAQYVPSHRRSLGYGFSNMAGFSLGGLGPAFAGYAATDLTAYGGLAVAAVLSGLVALILVAHRRKA
jgi:MFS transporter, FSR family, fosmidomycin resistance protein